LTEELVTPYRRHTIKLPALQPALGAEGRHRLSATLFGNEIFFESDVQLAPRTEAICTAFLIHAMALGYDLRSEGTVSGEWKSHLPAIQSIVHEWWGYQPTTLHAPTAPVCPSNDNIALFFTAGVDSFFSLQQEMERITHLVYIEGFDVTLSDAARLAAIRKANREIADALQKKSIHVRTNLRSHPLFRRLPWDQVYGAAIVAIGYLLSGSARTFLFASGAPKWQQFPRGNRGDLDPLWSSADVGFVHHGDDFDRQNKIAAIKGDRLAQGYLRVCWKNQPGQMNCGVCEKCVRTQLMLLVAGALGDFSTFPDVDLRHALAELPAVAPIQRYYYKELLQRLEDAAIKEEIQKLLGRQEPPRKRVGVLSRMKRRVSRYLQRAP
jgi:hypothetical protein